MLIVRRDEFFTRSGPRRLATRDWLTGDASELTGVEFSSCRVFSQTFVLSIFPVPDLTLGGANKKVIRTWHSKQKLIDAFRERQFFPSTDIVYIPLTAGKLWKIHQTQASRAFVGRSRYFVITRKLSEQDIVEDRASDEKKWRGIDN